MTPGFARCAPHRGLLLDFAVATEQGDAGTCLKTRLQLFAFATHAGIVFSREALLGKIWRGDTFVTVRSVDTLVKRLRRRIESDPANPRYLLTVWGVGYKFADV